MGAKIVFDIGGTKIRVARVENGELVSVNKIPTPDSRDESISALFEKIGELSNSEKVDFVSGCMAGIISRDGVVLNRHGKEEWKNFDLAFELKNKFSCEASLLNDASAAALGEAMYGAGTGFNIVAYLTVSTGVGGARVIGGKLDEYAYGFEPGNYIMDSQNKIRWEDVVSGSALQAKYGKHPKDLDREVYDEFTPILSIGIYNTILFWSPDIVVLGGSMMNDENGYRIDDVKTELGKLRQVLPALPEIKHSKLGDEAGLWGAVTLIN